jgi:hypothetical protein
MRGYIASAIQRPSQRSRGKSPPSSTSAAVERFELSGAGRITIDISPCRSQSAREFGQILKREKTGKWLIVHEQDSLPKE